LRNPLSKKGYVSVLVDPATQQRKWVHPNDIVVNINGLDQKLGDVLEDLEKNKTTQVEFENHKLKTKKAFKKVTELLHILVAQTEINNLGIEALEDIMEDNNDEE